MEGVEKRVLRRLLTFCEEQHLIGPYRIDGDTVHLTVKSEPHILTILEAFRYLLVLTEEAGLGDQFEKEMLFQ